MRTRDDIQAFIDRSGLTFKELDESTWIVRDPTASESVVIKLEDPLLVFRSKVMELEKVKNREALYSVLLELNASEMIHGAYGLADDSVVLTCSLRLENMDFNEFQGTIDDFTLAVTNHHSRLSAFVVQ
jgi:hypothetical protein